MELARRFTADVLVNAAREDMAARVLEETEGTGASVVIVAAPSAAQKQALTPAAKRGRVSFFGGLPKKIPALR